MYRLDYTMPLLFHPLLELVGSTTGIRDFSVSSVLICCPNQIRKLRQVASFQGFDRIYQTVRRSNRFPDLWEPIRNCLLHRHFSLGQTSCARGKTDMSASLRPYISNAVRGQFGIRVSQPRVQGCNHSPFCSHFDGDIPCKERQYVWLSQQRPSERVAFDNSMHIGAYDDCPRID